MAEREEILEISHRIAEAIGRRDVAWLSAVLAPGFVQRTPAGDTNDATAFLRAIGGIEAEILLVRLEKVEIDVADSGALATGVQLARVKVNGEEVEDRRGFVDWFVKVGGNWRLQVAVDLG
jgi:hypothetical protein